MQEYRIKWQPVPYNFNPLRVLFVEAESEDAARAVASDHIERQHGVGLYGIHSVEAYTRPTGGRVLEPR